MSKKLIVPKKQLPDPSIYSAKYPIRFRFTSEDRNSISSWSAIYNIDPEIFFERGTRELPGSIKLEKIGSSLVNVVWDSVTEYKDAGSETIDTGKVAYYDVWIRWAAASGATPSEWIYNERVASTSLNILVPTKYPYKDPITLVTTYPIPKYLYVEIYRPSREISRYEQTATFLQNASTVDISNNSFIFPDGHGSSTGTPGLYTSTTPIGGLVSGVVYYTRTINYYKFSMHPTLNDALANTNVIDLTGTPSGSGSFTGYPLRMYDALITTL